MGCVSSKLFREELRQDDVIVKHGGRLGLTHVVCLTSTTYGALDLQIKERHCNKNKEQEEEHKQISEDEDPIKGKKEAQSPVQDKPEVIDTWKLMEDLEEVVPAQNPNPPKKSPKSRSFFADNDATTPLKFLNQFGSPRKAKTFGGKENKARKTSDFSPRPVFKPAKSSKAVARLVYPTKEEQFKTPKNSNSILSSYKEKCPPGGENSVVIYTTTLRGIRKTFDDCNKVRSTIESHQVHMIERDISMDSGLREELRGLMGAKEVKVPAVFVKGRLIGGAEEVVKLEEEGKLGILFEGIGRKVGGECKGCAGIRFVMCRKCSGSCKVLDWEGKKMLKCGDCNENGLILCPICC